MVNPLRVFIRLLPILIAAVFTLFLLSLATSTPVAKEPEVKNEIVEVEPITIEATIKASKPLSQPIQQPVAYLRVGKLSPQAIKFLGNCESGNVADKDTGNGYYGAFQFTIGTWNAMNTGYARADLAPYSVQVNAVQRLLKRASIYTQFPACAIQMRNVGLI